uniref:Uncharacterized protein n=1 Tax=Arundo donax TaxID=35708 RepID=A0A0A8ZM54_ARUDO
MMHYHKLTVITDSWSIKAQFLLFLLYSFLDHTEMSPGLFVLQVGVYQTLAGQDHTEPRFLREVPAASASFFSTVSC